MKTYEHSRHRAQLLHLVETEGKYRKKWCWIYSNFRKKEKKNSKNNSKIVDADEEKNDKNVIAWDEIPMKSSLNAIKEHEREKDYVCALCDVWIGEIEKRKRFIGG